MLSRRQFISRSGIWALAPIPFSEALIAQVKDLSALHTSESPQTLAENETFWEKIQKAFHQSPDFINLENGYYSPMPQTTLPGLDENWKYLNSRPSFYMRRELEEDRTKQKERLAALAGCRTEELVITRNTTESLDTIILGLKMEAGEEAIFCDQDYLSMQEAFRQKARREGIVCKTIALPLHPDSDEQIVDIYRQAITAKTKVLLVTHLINISGQILPVRKICQMAHQRGVEVIVDGAHSFAHLDFMIPDLECDYYGASLHKWLCTPLGLGLLYINKSKIERVWPLFGDDTYADDDIRKFEHIGTQPVPIRSTLEAAIDFHLNVGAARKEARLRYLQQHWTQQVADYPGIVLNTPRDDARSCAIANVVVDGKSPDELADFLFDHYKIFTVAINRKSVNGVRITPHLYTRLEQLDLLVKALKEAAS